MARGLVLGLLVLTLFLLEAVVAPAVAVARVPPDLAVLAVVGLGLVDGPAVGARFGFVVGFFRDLLGAADGLMGPWMLALLVTGFLAGVARAYVPGTELRIHVAAGAAGAWFAWTVAGALSLVLTAGTVDAADVALRSLVAAAWGAVLGPVVARTTQGLVARMSVPAPP